MDQPNVVLPKELRLIAPATMPQSRSYMFKQQAALSDYSPGDTIQINLPRLQRSYLTKDSYLEFEVTYEFTPKNNETILSLDTPGAFGLIDRIEVYDYLGSTQLESTAGFGQLIALLQDTCVTTNEYGTHWESTSGGQTASITLDQEKRLNGTDNMRNYRQITPTTGELIDMGEYGQIAPNTSNVANARIHRRKYHIPLFSFLGLLSPKYAPLHNGYTIMITLQKAENALAAVGIVGATTLAAVGGAQPLAAPASVCKGEATFKIANARMCCQILELGPIAESMLLSTTGGQPMIVTTKAYRAYNSNVNDKASSFRLDLNINVASLTNVLWIMRPNWALNNLACNSLSRRQRNFLESWYFQYGSSVLPQTQGITCFKPTSNNVNDVDYGGESVIELLKARHMYNQPTHSHLFNRYNWAYDNWVKFREDCKRLHHANKDTILNEDFLYQIQSPVTPFDVPKFACGLDLELVSGRTNEIICGMNTNGMNTSIFATFNATAAGNAVEPTVEFKNTGNGIWVEACRVDAWCEYDAFINISPGIASTVSF